MSTDKKAGPAGPAAIGQEVAFDAPAIPVRLKPSQRHRLRLEAQWEVDCRDPDNWFQIPDFGVLPAEVNFVGFAFPIVTPSAQNYALAKDVRILVKTTRKLARRSFDSLADLQPLHQEAFKRFIDHDRSITLTTKHEVAFLYKYVMWSLEKSMHLSLEEPKISQQFLAGAAVALVEWSQGKTKRASEVAARARHSENHAMKEQLRAWYQSTRASFATHEESYDAATEVVPIKRSTAKAWILEFRKDMPPA